MPAAPSAAPGDRRAAEKTAVPPAGPPAVRGIQRGSFADAAAIITAPERTRQGFRGGWLANTGKGKTTSIRWFLQKYSVGFLNLIHDDKERDPFYPGAVVDRFEDAPGEAAQVVVRGDPVRGTWIEPDQVAALALELARSGVATRLVIDECDRACSPGGRTCTENVRKAFTVGRSLGLSVLYSGQIPQRIPTEILDLSSFVALGQLNTRSINYLDERLYFDPTMLEVLPSLGVGEFVLHLPGEEWNRTIYTTPPEAADLSWRKPAPPAELPPTPTEEPAA